MSFSNLLTRHAAVAALAVSCLAAPSAQASVVLQVNAQGILTGASGVTVGSKAGTFTVSFRDGTCASVFSSCVDPQFFLFKNFYK